MSAPIHDEDWDDRRPILPSTGAQVLLGLRRFTVGGQSTSAALRSTQEAYAASQADLTRALADGDRIAARLMDERVARDLAEAELVTARAELELLRKNEEIRAQVIRELRAELADRKGGTNG